MFGQIKKYKENKQKAQLIKELNAEIDNYISDLDSQAKELSEDLIGSSFMFDIRYGLNALKIRENEFALSCHTIEELINTKKTAATLYEAGKKSIAPYWEKAKANKEELDKLFEKGVPLFITMTSLVWGTKKYAMCYEIKKYEGDEYHAFLFKGSRKEGWLETFKYLDYKIEPMTEEEFEHDYIMQRLGLMNFASESEAIEYDNYLRRLFHGQREII